MELKQLEYFMAVCKELHFTRAAESLGIAQPSLSQQIRLLEHELGTPLFDRSGKRTALTEAGRILQAHGFNVFHELSQARAAIGELQGLSRGSLKIGALLTVVHSILPPNVASFHRLYPQLELSVLGLRTGDIYDGLIRNELDLGIVYLPAEREELESVPLYEETLAVAAPAEHPLASGPDVELDALRDVPCVLLPKSYALRRLIDARCAELGFAPKPALEMTTMESIIAMVEQGVGVAVLPESYLRDLARPRLATLPLRSPSLSLDIGVVYRKNKHLCAASRAFLEHLTFSPKHTP